MKIFNSLKNAYQKFGHSIQRFPLTVLFLIAAAFINSLMIEKPQDDYIRWLFTFLMGTMLSIVGQVMYERFFESPSKRYLIMGASILLTVVYYFLLTIQQNVDVVSSVRTSVMIFSLFIAYIWIPTINNDRFHFYQNFLLILRYFFTTLLFTAVLSLGIMAIFQAVNILLFETDYKIASHVINVVVTIFSPIYFLSLTATYTFNEDEANDAESELTFEIPVFIDRLITFIIIPLLSVYTFILVAYIFMQLGNDFWTNNLLEPLLVSYSLISIIVILLSFNLTHKIAVIFRKVFPKVLVPIVTFQTIASILKIREMGITHGRYYVILFGVFSIIAGLILSFMEPKKHGLLAPILIALATLSIIPPIDAFTVSKNNQINLLTETLTETNLLQNNKIIPNSDIATDDKIIITSTTSYLFRMEYINELAYLPDDFVIYNDFNETFGFQQIYSEETSNNMSEGQFAYYVGDFNIFYDIQDYDFMGHERMYSYFEDDVEPLESNTFQVDHQEFTLHWNIVGNYYQLEIQDANGNTLINYDTQLLYEGVFGQGDEPMQITIEEDFSNGTFIEENEKVRIKMIVLALDKTSSNQSAEFYLFIDIK